jgi:hypothetical protein
MKIEKGWKKEKPSWLATATPIDAPEDATPVITPYPFIEYEGEEGVIYKASYVQYYRLANGSVEFDMIYELIEV